MCDVVGKAYALGLSRRAFLGRAGVAAGALAGGSLLAGEPALANGRPPAPTRGGPPIATGGSSLNGYRTKLVLLGTSGGPVWWPGSDRMGISQAVAVGENVYLIDCGDGVGFRYHQTDLAVSQGQAPAMLMSRLKAVFLTHLHSDHTIDYPNIPIFGLFAGLQQPRPPVQVYGPANRGALPDVLPPGRPAPPVIDPANPTPGTVEMTELLYQAYATDLNDRLRDSGAPDPHTRLQPNDIPTPAGANPHQHPPARIKPFQVFQDDRVRVTATLVDHGQVFPSYGFRFDTDDGSVVFSGDTAPSPNLIELAQGADVLVHEVIDRLYVEAAFGQPPYPPDIQAIVDHLLGAHTTIEDVGPVAEQAGVRTLVLSHLVPGNNPVERWMRAQAGFSGRLVVGEDLMQIGIGARSRAGMARR